MSGFKRAASAIILLVCFGWFLFTIYLFSQDVMAWKNMVEGVIFSNSFGYFILRNLPTMAGLYLVYYWNNY